MARPRIPIDTAEVERLASVGLTDAQICDALGIHVATLRRRKRDATDVAAALARGRARGTAAVASALYQRAVDGDLKAMTFFLRSRSGWAPAQDRPYAVDPFEKSSVALNQEMAVFNQRVTQWLRAASPKD